MFKNTYLIIMLLITFLFSHTVHSQTALPWLLVQPSPELNGMAGAFTALPTDDPYGSYYNPAQIGNFSRNTNFAAHFYLNDVTWLPEYRIFNFQDLAYNNIAFGLGYNLQNIYPKVPLSIGLGYIRTSFEIQNHHVTDENGNDLGTFTSLETADAFSIGLTLDYVVLFSLGYTFKHISSDRSDRNIQVGAEMSDDHYSVNAGDFGAQLILPILKSYEFLSENKTVINNNFQPVLNISLGYAISNIGDKITYNADVQPDLLPRQARVDGIFDGTVAGHSPQPLTLQRLVPQGRRTGRLSLLR